MRDGGRVAQRGPPRLPEGVGEGGQARRGRRAVVFALWARGCEARVLRDVKRPLICSCATDSGGHALATGLDTATQERRRQRQHGKPTRLAIRICTYHMYSGCTDCTC